jgi:hypothetical protein
MERQKNKTKQNGQISQLKEDLNLRNHKIKKKLICVGDLVENIKRKMINKIERSNSKYQYNSIPLSEFFSKFHTKSNPGHLSIS